MQNCLNAERSKTLNYVPVLSANTFANYSYIYTVMKMIVNYRKLNK